jgi:pimeloyl-ACP methyl ester carboxylesterase
VVGLERVRRRRERDLADRRLARGVDHRDRPAHPLRDVGLLTEAVERDAERLERRAVTIELIREGGPAALWEDMRGKLFSDDADPAVVERARSLALDRDADGLVRAVEAIRDRRDTTGVVASLEAPVLVAVGEADPYVPREVAENLAASARDGRIAIYPGGHLPNLEHAEQFNRALTALLDEIGRA